MLKDNFYHYTIAPVDTDHTVHCRVRFNRDHAIFEGHFPGLPVVPGVCMMAIIKETLETALNRKLILERSSALKFLSLINPVETKETEIEVRYSLNEDGTVVADGSISWKEIVFFKISKAVYH